MGIVRRLPDEVVRRIAAGEVIVRPASAVKELMENSLDAGATEISVTIGDGGIRLIEVADNGSGIGGDDIELVCERFATSKLRELDDLSRMNTFGFRGEALASIAMVATLTLTSRLRGQPYAHQIVYKDGQKVGKVRVCAGVEGTVVRLEELFEGSGARRHSLQNTAEEAGHVADIIARYATHRPDVSFLFRRGGTGCDFRTPGKVNGDGTHRDAVRVLFGGELSKELISLSHSEPLLYLKLTGVMSKPFSTRSAASKNPDLRTRRNRQKQFFLFINGRSVSCQPLKSTMDSALAARGLAATLLLLSLEIEPSRVDVNVHPTKASVQFLQQEEIIDAIQSASGEREEGRCVQTLIRLCSQKSTAPTTYIDGLLALQLERESTAFASISRPHSTSAAFLAPSISKSSSRPEPKKRADHKLVRVSGTERRLEEFFLPGHAAAHLRSRRVPLPPSKDVIHISRGKDGKLIREFDLASLHCLRKRISSLESSMLRPLFRSFFLVGFFSPRLVLLQHRTNLYAVLLQPVLKEFFYQMLLASFGNMSCFRFKKPLAVVTLLKSAMPREEESKLKQAAAFFLSQSEMLNDYFSLSFCEEPTENSGNVVCLATIPSLMRGHIAQLAALPSLLSSLLVDVDWDEEEACLEGVSRSLAVFLSLNPKWTTPSGYSAQSGSPSWKAVLADIVMPGIKQHLIPLPRWAEDGTIRSLASLHDMYKVFERC